MTNHSHTTDRKDLPSAEFQSLLGAHQHHDASGKFFEDAVYTLNHALVCLSMDIAVAPAVGHFSQKWFNKRINIWHAHDHGDHGHDHHHHDHDHHDHHHHHFGEGQFWHWVVGEVLGDVAAVPVTVGMDYVAPGLMRPIQTVSEPFLGPIFKRSAQNSARKWAHNNGYAVDSNEAKARAQEIYQHEVSHLPHAFMWTASSSVMNLAIQRAVGNKGPLSGLIFGKLNASMFPLVTTLGLRALSPDTVQQIDHFNATRIAEPITRWVGGLVGISDQRLDELMDQERETNDGHHIIEASRKIKNEKSHAANTSFPESTINAVAVQHETASVPDIQIAQ